MGRFGRGAELSDINTEPHIDHPTSTRDTTMQSSSYFNLLTITAHSAADTAAICYRKARRDCWRIHALVTHPRTVQAVKVAVWSLYVGAVVAFALGQTARIIIQSWVDGQVETCLERPIAEAPAAEPADPFGTEANPHYPATITCTYAGLTVPQLRTLGQQAKVPGARAARKAQLLAALPTDREVLMALAA